MSSKTENNATELTEAQKILVEARDAAGQAQNAINVCTNIKNELLELSANSNFAIAPELKERYKKYLLTKVANPELLENEEFLAAVDGVCSTFTPELVLVICLTMPHGLPLEDVLG